MSEAPEAAIALARRHVNETVAKIVATVAHADAFDVLDAISFQHSLVDLETYRESEHGATGAAIELTALILAARSSRVDAAPPEEAEPVPAGGLGSLLGHLQELMTAGQVLNMLSIDRGDPLHHISFGTRLREVAVRNAAYPHMVEDTLAGRSTRTSGSMTVLCGSAEPGVQRQRCRMWPTAAHPPCLPSTFDRKAEATAVPG